MNCIHRDKDEGDNDTGIQMETVWQASETFKTDDLEMKDTKPASPLEFKIPYDAGQTGLRSMMTGP